MKRAIYLFAAALMASGAAAQTQTPSQALKPITPATQTYTIKDPLATARELYHAGQWESAEYEFDKASYSVPGGGVQEIANRIEAETFATICAMRLERPDAEARLRALLQRYPASPYTPVVRFMLGVLCYNEGNYAKAMEVFETIQARRLAQPDRDELYFKRGHSYFEEKYYEKARNEFSQVSRIGTYAPHADYYTAYLDYIDGHYTSAKQRFQAIVAHPSYTTLIPYYLVQIAFIEGDYRYVTENIEPLIPQTAMPRRAELAGMAAMSWFRLGEYEMALQNVAKYRELGGVMTRMEHYTEGYSLYKSERREEAIPHLTAATGADDAISQSASYHLADIYLRMGDKQRALQSFSIAAASGADKAVAEDAMFNYGKLLFETGGGRFNEAINIITRYIADHPGTSSRTREAREYLIAAYYNSNNYEAALAAIMQHPDPDNNVKAALQKISYYRALELLGERNYSEAMRLLGISAKNRYNSRYTALTEFWQGEILFQQGDWQVAIPRYEEYLKLSPTTENHNRLARYNLGYANFNLKKWGDASMWFADFVERYNARDSYRADAFNRLGDINHAQRNYWKAIENYDAAAAINTPEKYYSAYQRAMMLGLVDRPDRKIESLQAIINANQGDWVEPAAYELGRYYISQDKYSDGARQLVNFIGQYPESQYYLAALSNLGLAYHNLRDEGQSMKYYKMIVEKAPYSREAQDAMGVIRGIYVDANDVDGYIDYTRTSGIPSTVGEAQRDSLNFTTAERIYLSGDSNRAITALEEYIKSDARGQYVPAAMTYLSSLYFAVGRWEDAANQYKRTIAVAIDPAMKTRALEGYVASSIATKDPARIKAMADEVAAEPSTPEKSRLDAAFAKAGVLRTEGRRLEAIDIYRSLAENTRTAQGAESAFRVIEYLYETGDYRRAEEAVFAFSQAGTPHGYWLGEAFLTLGDIYIREGDTFQARATFQSIVDGYSPADDGIVAAAKERIAALK
ncbi:MAG: tetratricopeptide repeat protein [Alistipes sp.]|jgi:TolA-binding protein|nr:tetratricopeptide repeat protein [Alistipes sp.]